MPTPAACMSLSYSSILTLLSLPPAHGADAKRFLQTVTPSQTPCTPADHHAHDSCRVNHTRSREYRLFLALFRAELATRLKSRHEIHGKWSGVEGTGLRTISHKNSGREPDHPRLRLSREYGSCCEVMGSTIDRCARARGLSHFPARCHPDCNGIFMNAVK